MINDKHHCCVAAVSKTLRLGAMQVLVWMPTTAFRPMIALCMYDMVVCIIYSMMRVLIEPRERRHHDVKSI